MSGSNALNLMLRFILFGVDDIRLIHYIVTFCTIM